MVCPALEKCVRAASDRPLEVGGRLLKAARAAASAGRPPPQHHARELALGVAPRANPATAPA